MQNIGFGADSTFAANRWSYHAHRICGSLTEIRHPTFMLPYPDVTERILRRASGLWWPRMLAVWCALKLIRVANILLRPFGRRVF